MAALLNTSPSGIFFTSGGTEADNTALRCTIEGFGIGHAITSPLEHHAVLHTLEDLWKKGKIELSFVRVDRNGYVDMEHLRELLANSPGSLVSLMHANNETGNLTDIGQVGEWCREHNAIFHSDTVQTVGHYRHDLQRLNLNFMVGAAPQVSRPKGVGFLYVNTETKIAPLSTADRRNATCGGTENVYGIIGLSKALEIAYRDMDAHQRHIQALKDRMINRLRRNRRHQLQRRSDRPGELSVYGAERESASFRSWRYAAL